jgi:hypothetical protein
VASGSLLLVQSAPRLRLDRVHVGEAPRAAGKPLGPEPPKLLDVLLLERAPFLPFPQGLPNDLAV